MKAIIKDSGTAKESEHQLRTFLAKYEPKHQTLFRAVRKTLRKRFPTANEIAYDYSHSLVIGYSPTEKGYESILSTATGADGLRLYFASGPKLPDPKKILLGSAKQVRYIHLASVKDLARPEVKALIAAAIAHSKSPYPRRGGGVLIIQTNSATKKSRRRPQR